MTSRTIANRYAKALLDVARTGGDLDSVERQLGAFTDGVAAHPDLARVFSSPAVPAARKRAVLSEIIARDGGFSPIVTRLLLLLADRDRLGLLPEIRQAFSERLLDERQIVRARVTTAMPLPKDRLEALRQGLAEATGKQVRLDAAVDPAIIGGVVARVGSVVYDGSVARQLERMKARLAEEA